MLGTNAMPFLKPWGVQVETVVIEDGAETQIQFLGIVTAPGRVIDFGGIPIVSDDYSVMYATSDVTLAEKAKITVLSGPHVGAYSVRELTPSSDRVFTTAKLAKIL